MATNLLEVKNLKTYFSRHGGVVKEVDDVSFAMKPGETLGVVGESGCGKSVTALSVMRLVSSPPGKIIGGEITFNGENILEKDRDEMSDLRGSKISMIFQDPMTSLNPVFTIGYQIAETVKRHRKDINNDQAWKRVELRGLPTVGMGRAVPTVGKPRSHLSTFSTAKTPHECSRLPCHFTERFPDLE